MKVNVKDVMTTRVIWVKKVVGVVSEADMLARNGLLADHDTIKVAVKDEAVTLTGVAEPGTIRHETMRRIRHIQDVVAVRDRLSYPPLGPWGFDTLANFPID